MIHHIIFQYLYHPSFKHSANLSLSKVIINDFFKMSFKSVFFEKPSIRWLLFTFWTLVVIQLLSSNFKSQLKRQHDDSIRRTQYKNNLNQLITADERTTQVNHKSSSFQDDPTNRMFGIIFAEAGKKKKKEKSEVVVISVNNPSKGHGGMYPIYIPTCGGGHGGGYGRRKRSISHKLGPRMSGSAGKRGQI